MDPRRLAPLPLFICGVVLLVIGWYGLTEPATLMAPLDIPVADATAHSEIRAAYGGMHVGMGLFLLATALSPALHDVGLWANACIMGGLVAGRVASLVVDGVPAGFALSLLAAEATGALTSIALIAARTRDR